MNMRGKIPVMVSLALLTVNFCFAQTHPLQQQIQEIVKGKQLTVGVAIITENGDTIVANNDQQYPMQSTYKFHLALAILDLVDQGRLDLDQQIFVSQKDLLPDTYSPLREKYPAGNLYLPLREIIEYTVQQSDNNGCDILFRLAGGTENVDQYIRSTGIEDIHIVATEEEMHKDWDTQYANWTTPLGTARLLEMFYDRKLISETCRQFLWEVMAETKTGANRLKAGLPENTILAHKTGSGGVRDGVTSACNDIGIIQLPDGTHFIIVVYVKDSKESNEVNERVIAGIAKAAWNFCSLPENKNQQK